MLHPSISFTTSIHCIEIECWHHLFTNKFGVKRKNKTHPKTTTTIHTYIQLLLLKNSNIYKSSTTTCSNCHPNVAHTHYFFIRLSYWVVLKLETILSEPVINGCTCAIGAYAVTCKSSSGAGGLFFIIIYLLTSVFLLLRCVRVCVCVQVQLK